MSVVRINAIEVPPERAAELERRFEQRAGEVEGQEGFLGFELLRPTDGKSTYLVYTRWRSEEDFRRWVESDAFRRGHAAHDREGPVAPHSELWAFEVAQEATAAQ